MKYLAAFLLLTLIPALICQEDCGPNQRFDECGPHRMCEATCTFIPDMCPRACERGCFCLPGFIRRSFLDWSCIPEHEC